MENPEQKLDDLFRQRLHGAEVPPPPFVWPALEAELRKKRRRPILLFWLLGFIGVCTGMGLWYFITMDQASSLASSAPNPSEQEALGPESKTLTMATGETTPVPEPAAAEPRQEMEPSTTQSAKGQLRSRGVAQKAENVKVKGLETRPQAYSMPESPFVETSADAPLAAAETSTISGSVEAGENQANQTLAKSSLDQTAAVTLPPQMLERSLRAPLITPKKFKTTNSKSSSRQKLCYDFTRQPSAWLVDVYGGPSLAQRSLTSALDDQPYLNQRLSTEHRNLAYQAGARVSLMFKGNFLVRSGVHYEQITETFEYIDPTSVTYSIRWYPGNPVPDTIGVMYGENYLKTYNRYFFVDVPLTLGMEMRSGRSGFSINAGIMANLLFNQRGVIIDPQSHQPARFGPIGKVAPKNGLSEEVFRPSAGFSATASVQWFWHLSPHYRIFVEPSFRQILRPVSLASHPVEHRYSIFSLKLGATKIF